MRCFIGLVLLALWVGCVEMRAIDNEQLDDNLQNDIKRLLDLLKNEKTRMFRDDADDADDVHEEGTEEELEDAAIRKLEAYLHLQDERSARGLHGLNDVDRHKKIEQLVKAAREEENTVYINHGVVKKPAHSQAAEYIERNELAHGDDVIYPSGMDKRKVANSARWPGGVMPWQFDPAYSVPNARDVIRNAVKRWEEVTCLKLPEVNGTQTEQYIQVTNGGGCWSYVGMVNTNGKIYQQLSIAQGCHYHGIVVHEFGHALGFNHEQSRTDRDKHVTIHFENIQSGKASNFDMRTNSENKAPYDVKSVMHYGRTAFSKNGKNTISSLNADEMAFLGNRIDLTPYDIKAASDAYGCADHCAGQPNTPTCTNGGFLFKDCTCYCPTGLGGADCSIPDPTWSACGGIIELNSQSETFTIQSPNYPSAFTAGDKCAWVFKTTLLNSLIEIKLIDLDTTDNINTCKSFVEVRKNLPQQEGLRLCGTSSHGSVSTPLYTLSTKVDGLKQMSVLFMGETNDGAAKFGFQAIVGIKPTSACLTATCLGHSTCEDNGSLTGFTCKCEAGFAGANCTDFIPYAVVNEDFEGINPLFSGEWLLGSGPTPSSSTGPTGDHTTGQGNYMYFESSSPRKTGDQLSIISNVDFSSGVERCMDFYYHMYGSSMGSLAVMLAISGMPEAELFKITGDQGNQWLNKSLIIPSTTSSYTIMFEATRGSSYRSDMAVDDISIRPCHQPTTTPHPVTHKPTTPHPVTHKPTTPHPVTHKPTTPHPVTHKPTTPHPVTHKPSPNTNYPHPVTHKPSPNKNKGPINVYVHSMKCDFEQDLEKCFYTNSGDAPAHFVRTDSCLGTLSPCMDHTTGKGYYLVFRPEPVANTFKGVLLGPWMVLDKKNVCVGGFFAGSSAKVAVQKLNKGKIVQENVIPPTTDWAAWNHTMHVDREVFRVVITANATTSVDYVAIDDLYIESGFCDSTKPTLAPTTTAPHVILLMDDFDGNEVGGGLHDAPGFLAWKPRSGGTPSGFTGPVSGASGTGNYLYVEVSQRNSGVIFKTESGTINTGSGHVCLYFELHAYGSTLGEFRAEIKDAKTNQVYAEVVEDATTLDVTSQLWHHYSLSADIAQADVIVSFSVVRGSSYRGDYAIDDVLMFNGKCNSP